MLKKQRKLLTCTMLLLALFFCSNAYVTHVSAETFAGEAISVKSVNTVSSRVYMSISNSGNASISAGVIGKAGTEKIQLTVHIQKYDNKAEKWVNIETWEKTKKSCSVSIDDSTALASRGTYRCKSIAKVSRDGKTEVVTMTSEKKKY